MAERKGGGVKGLLMRRRDVLALGLTAYAFKQMVADGTLRPLPQHKGKRKARKLLFLRNEVEAVLKVGEGRGVE